ncbi:MAG: hypothetical protein M3Y81_05885 [Chloroflexota bacterium]|nr:hypothetical protein [Chloroflexota bacterium]
MAERTTQAGIDQAGESDTRPMAGNREQAASPPAIIWTPPFIIIFTLTLALGLSVESVLTQGWQNALYAGSWVLLGHVVLIAPCWFLIVMRPRSLWARVGGIFGCLWAIFAGINFIVTLFPLAVNGPVIAHLNAASSSALLGAYICFSIEHTPLHRWDSWFFGLALIGGSAAVILTYFLAAADTRGLSTLESGVGATATILCVLVWWLRPSCWKTQPGPTLLFGLAPSIQLLLAIPNITFSGTNFFFSQVVLLCILLGALRTLQGQLVRSKV